MAFTRFLHEAIAWGPAVLPTLAGHIPLTAELRAAGGEYEHALDELITAVQHAGQLRPDIAAGDIPLLLISVTRQPATGDAAITYARHLAVLLDGLRARPDNTRLPGNGLDSDDVHGLYLDQDQ